MRSTLKTGVFILVISFLVIQNKGFSSMLDSVAYVSKLDSLKAEYPKIRYDGPYSVSFYAALNGFPELKNISVQFRERSIKTTMQCRPKTFSVLRKPQKRKFLMVFNHNRGRSRGVPINKLSFNARVGLFAHELAHIVDYQKMSGGEIFGLGIRYLFGKGKIELEHKIDRIVIWKGFGSQIFQYAKEVLKSNSISDDYRKRRQRVYLQPSEIKELVDIVENMPANVKR